MGFFWFESIFVFCARCIRSSSPQRAKNSERWCLVVLLPLTSLQKKERLPTAPLVMFAPSIGTTLLCSCCSGRLFSPQTDLGWSLESLGTKSVFRTKVRLLLLKLSWQTIVIHESIPGGTFDAAIYEVVYI